MARPGGNPDIAKHGKATQFGGENGNDNTKGGGKKKIYTVLKEMGYGKEDIRTALMELPWYTLPELKELYDDDSKPIITRIIARALFEAVKKGDWAKIKDIMDQAIGKAGNFKDVPPTPEESNAEYILPGGKVMKL